MNRPFARARHGPVLSYDERTRQGRVVRSALAALGDGEARGFLNGHHDGLRGRPLDLAVASQAGLEAVEAALCVEARRPAQSG